MFFFYVSNMGKALHTINTSDFNDPYNLAQLADDTALLAEYFDSLSKKFEMIFGYSEDKYQIPNVKKTLYGNFTEHPETRPMPVGDHFINEYSTGFHPIFAIFAISPQVPHSISTCMSPVDNNRNVLSIILFPGGKPPGPP